MWPTSLCANTARDQRGRAPVRFETHETLGSGLTASREILRDIRSGIDDSVATWRVDRGRGYTSEPCSTIGAVWIEIHMRHTRTVHAVAIVGVAAFSLGAAVREQ